MREILIMLMLDSLVCISFENLMTGYPGILFQFQDFNNVYLRTIPVLQLAPSHCSLGSSFLQILADVKVVNKALPF